MEHIFKLFKDKTKTDNYFFLNTSKMIVTNTSDIQLFICLLSNNKGNVKQPLYINHTTEIITTNFDYVFIEYADLKDDSEIKVNFL